MHVNTGDDVATLCKKYGELWSSNLRDDDAHLCICVPVVGENWPVHFHLSHCHCKTYWTVDGHINSGEDQSTSDIHLVGFCPVTPELMWLNSI